jgi:RimJ/RimL family protein N-acetyltransferase
VCGATLPRRGRAPTWWRAFTPSLGRSRRPTPGCGATLLITAMPPAGGRQRRFHGRPADGIAEVGYGVDDAAQRQGYATEGTRACVDWALGQPGVVAVTAVTFPWHTASLRVIERCGMRPCGQREHPFLGELLVFERRRS